MPKIEFATDANAYRVTLNDPPLNIMDIAMLEELRDALDRVKNDRHAVIIAANGGKTFSAGASVQDHMGDRVVTMLGHFHDCFRILEELGFRVWFRYQKYREEFVLDDVIVAVDETPVGTFVEIEGGDRGIADMTNALGRSPSDYLLDSYRGLFCAHCRQLGLPLTDMVFDNAD